MVNTAEVIINWEPRETVSLPLLGYHTGDNPTKCRGWVTVRCDDRELGHRLPQWAERTGNRYRVRETDVANIEEIWKRGEFGET